MGANSPSLCPTICSVTNTGTCFRPSWTAIVCPTISGKTVEARDHVRTMRFEPEVFISEQMVGHKLGEFAPTRMFRGHAGDRQAQVKKR